MGLGEVTFSPKDKTAALVDEILVLNRDMETQKYEKKAPKPTAML